MRISTRPFRRLLWWPVLAALLWLPAGASQAQPANADLASVLEQVRAVNAQAATELADREAEFQSRLEAARARVRDAEATVAAREAEGRRLELTFDANEQELTDKAQRLKDKIGALKELFGVFQQTASDLIGAFSGSTTSIQYPDRDRWLEAFANRMKNASEVSSIEDIRGLWFEMQREIAALGHIVALTAPVRELDGSVSDQALVRVGNFNLVTAQPQVRYLTWDAGTQQVLAMERQPAGAARTSLQGYLAPGDGLRALDVDPTGGVLLSLLAQKPTLSERVDQGALVGYMILGLGAMALALALLKLLQMAWISVAVVRQQRRVESPRQSNALGRVLLAYQANRGRDPETLAQHLHAQVARESTRVHRFTVFLAIIAAVAPLMGLLGTVVGMINTFQAITLYGTGDPQTMAGGISQALITTVLGLVVAVPAVLLHAIVSARGRAVVQQLNRHAARLTGDHRAEAGHPMPATAASPASPVAAVGAMS